jgi:glycosyltransferase involved in cell wall biosynthesis
MTPNPELREHFVNADLRVRDRGPVKENPAAYLWRSLGPRDIAWLRRILLEERANIVHAHTFGSQVLAARVARQLNIPLVRTEHGVGVYRDPGRAFLRKWALRRAARIVAVSEAVRVVVERADPTVRERVRVIRNGIDAAHFRAAPISGDGPFIFSMLSRLERVKRVDMAIAAIAHVPGVQLEIIGGGSQRAELEELSQQLGVGDRVTFLGYLSDPRPAIARASALINCTREEGLPLAVLEAASMERPTIAYAGGGIPEVVQEGRTGWLVHEHTAGAFARTMVEAARDRARAKELGANARKLVVAQFDVDHMRRGYSVVYSEVLRA